MKRLDPDLILTEYGDTWLFPHLTVWSKESGIDLNPNRDESREILTHRADSYFAYGQVIYRGAQAHLFGRWHIDRHNAMSFGEYGLEGVMEHARVTGLGLNNGKATVGPQSIGPEHNFANLSGKDNAVLFYTNRYNEQPLVIKGAGAGADVTAAGVFADIVRAAR